MLRYELSCPKGRLLLSVLMLKDAGCNHHAVAGVDQVVSHESRHLADEGHKALLGHLRHFFWVTHALVAPHRNVHSSLAYLLSEPPTRDTAGSNPFQHNQGVTFRRPVQTS